MKVASLEVSKKLVALDSALVGETHFIHARQVSWDGYTKEEYAVMPRDSATVGIWESFPAPTACELGELLPWGVDITFRKGTKFWHVESIQFDRYQYADTLADAMGLMLVWLKENGHMEKEEGK